MNIRTTVLLALALTGNVAHADTGVAAENFGIVTLNAFDPIDFQLLSDTGSTVSVAVGGFIPAANFSVRAGYGQEAHGFGFDSSLRFNVREGYRITSLTFSGTAVGALEVGDYPAGTPAGEVPFAWSSAGFSWTIDGASQSGYQVGVRDVNGTEAFTGTVAQSIEGSQVLNFYNDVYVSAMGYGDSWGVNPSSASLAVRDVVMTVQIAAIPEPGTYAMLLAGFGILGVAARKRRRKA